MDLLKLECERSKHRLECRRVIWKKDSRASWIGVNDLQHGLFGTGEEFKMMRKRLISDAQLSAGDVKFLNSKKKSGK